MNKKKNVFEVNIFLFIYFKNIYMFGWYSINVWYRLNINIGFNVIDYVILYKYCYVFWKGILYVFFL